MKPRLCLAAIDRLPYGPNPDAGSICECGAVIELADPDHDACFPGMA